MSKTHRCEVVTSCNQKGGQGKTTTVIHLVYGALARGMRVLAIDADGQASLTKAVGLDADGQADIYEWVYKGEDARRHHPDGFDLIPASQGGITCLIKELEKDTVAPAEYIKDALEEIKGEYDLVVIDTPPALGLPLTNALMASDSVLIPVQPEYLAADGLAQMQMTIRRVQKKNPKLKVAGAIITQYNPQSSEHELMSEIAEAVNAKFGAKVFNTRIRISRKVAEKQRSHTNPYGQISKNRAAQDYLAVVDEFLDSIA